MVDILNIRLWVIFDAEITEREMADFQGFLTAW